MNKISKLSIIFMSLIVVISIAYNYATSFRMAVFLNWNMKLPNGYDIIYSINDKGAFGDGVRYTVLYYKDGIRQSFLDEFSLELNEKLETEIIEHLVNFKIEPNKTIDFNSSYYWIKVIHENGKSVTRALYLIYQPHNQFLYVVEFKV